MQQPRNEAEEGGDNVWRWPAAIRRLIDRIAHPYRPERHYMRGGRAGDAAERRRAPTRSTSH
jgi:hypothetical protein